MNSFLLIWSLCKRDYAIQFAGSILGLFWVVIQSVVLISLYLMIFWVLDIHPTSKASSISYIITGILFWLPIQEFLNRGTVILTENRQLIKKTGLGVNIFLKVPLFQMYLHFLILSIPCYIVLYFLGSLNLSFFFVSFIWYIILGLILYPIISYLGRANVILKDISPVIRLFLQVLFWGSPLLYFPPEKWIKYLSLNPLYDLVEIFRYFILNSYNLPSIHSGIIWYLPFSVILFYFSGKYLHRLVLDEL